MMKANFEEQRARREAGQGRGEVSALFSKLHVIIAGLALAQ